MPLHDWTRVPPGLFHHFHQDWSIEIARTLNRGLLPKGLSALVGQQARPRKPEVVVAPPVTSIMSRTTNEIYSVRANRVVVRHHLGRIVAVIEVVSPGN